MGRLESLAEQRLLLQPTEEGAGALFMFARARFPSYNPTGDAAFLLQVDLTPPTLCSVVKGGIEVRQLRYR